MEDNTIISCGNYRICKISQITAVEAMKGPVITTLPISDGLGVEKLTSTGANYIVITLVKWDDTTGHTELQHISDRILEVEDDEFSDYKKMLKRAIRLVESQHMEKTEDDNDNE